jgi:hypothetical protein
VREAIREYYSPPASGAPSKELTTLLKDTIAATRERSPSYESIYVMLPDGGIISSTHPPSEDFLELQRQGFTQRLLEVGEPAFGSL